MSLDPKVRLLRPENFHAAESPPQPEAFQRHGDGGGHGPYDGGMTSPSREEINAKLEAIEAKTSARVDVMLAKMDAFIVKAEEREKSLKQSTDHMDAAIKGINDDLKQDKTDRRAENKSLKTTIITTAAASVIAIVGGVAAFNATVLSNMVASFESGKNTATSIAAASDQLKQTQDQLKQIQDALQAQAIKQGVTQTPSPSAAQPPAPAAKTP